MSNSTNVNVLEKIDDVFGTRTADIYNIGVSNEPSLESLILNTELGAINPLYFLPGNNQQSLGEVGMVLGHRKLKEPAFLHQMCFRFEVAKFDINGVTKISELFEIGFAHEIGHALDFARLISLQGLERAVVQFGRQRKEEYITLPFGAPSSRVQESMNLRNTWLSAVAPKYWSKLMLKNTIAYSMLPTEVAADDNAKQLLAKLAG